jgi:hypothetical protein
MHMMLSRQTVYDLENTYDQIAEEDEELVDKMFSQLQPLLGQVASKLKYKKDEIDDKLVTQFLQAAKDKNIPEKWAKGYLFYHYFDDDEE